MRRLARTNTMFALLLAVAALACADETSPTSTRPPAKHPLIGVYDVTTVLDSFSLVGTGFDECHVGNSDCAFVRPSTGGLLQGTLIIGDSVIVSDTVYPGVGLPPRPVLDTIVYRLPIVSGSFVGQSCTNIDVTHKTGCIAFADTLRADYKLISAPIATGSFPGSQRHFVVRLLSTSEPQRTLLLTSTRDAGDTIWGRLTWQTFPSRLPPTFYGEFRAVQRR